MDKQIRRIGVLTSGGDAPGMNALIRSVVRSASGKRYFRFSAFAAVTAVLSTATSSRWVPAV